MQTNPNAMACIAHDAIYTNVGLLPDGDVWWEGKTAHVPAECIDWTGQKWTADCGRKAAHPNSRFTAPMKNNPVLDPAADDPAGVPVSAILFGGRRSRAIPLVAQSFNWAHGVYVGSTLASETTAAASGAVGVVRRDPMAMLPFIGYNAGAYLAHWLRMGKALKDAPAIFQVNWFRKDEAGKFLWPGFGENMRVLKWIIDRVQGKAAAVQTPLGWMPKDGDFDLHGLDISVAHFAALQAISVPEVHEEIAGQQELFLKLGADLPKELLFERELLVCAM